MDTTVGRLIVNSFGWAFIYDYRSESLMVDKKTMTLPIADKDICVVEDGSVRDLTAEEQEYFDFRELGHKEKLVALNDDPTKVRHIVSESMHVQDSSI